jgi:hypothetical protein
MDTLTHHRYPATDLRASDFSRGGNPNLNAQERSQKAGNLEPFRQGGCRCRTWGYRLGTQCTRKDLGDGLCKMHAKKINSNGGWHLGCYDEPRPEKWGDVSEYVPKWEKKGGNIAWTMTPEAYGIAFPRDVKQIETEESPEPIAITPAEPADPAESVEESVEETGEMLDDGAGTGSLADETEEEVTHTPVPSASESHLASEDGAYMAYRLRRCAKEEKDHKMAIKALLLARKLEGAQSSQEEKECIIAVEQFIVTCPQ